jgi:hypothetical protein
MELRYADSRPDAGKAMAMMRSVTYVRSSYLPFHSCFFLGPATILRQSSNIVCI